MKTIEEAKLIARTLWDLDIHANWWADLAAADIRQQEEKRHAELWREFWAPSDAWEFFENLPE